MGSRNLFLSAALAAALAACTPAGPSTGSSVTFAHDDFLCQDQPSLQAMMRAYYASDETGERALFGSGVCWTDSAGTHARVLDHGSVDAQDGRNVPTTELRMQDGTHPQAVAWTIVRADGL